MTRLLALPTTLFVLSAMLYTSVTPASACFCNTGSISERVERSDLVFIGEVVGVQPPPSGQPPFAWLEKTTILQVERYLKGTGGAEQAVNDSAGGGASCGYFEADTGQRHLIFAQVDSGTARTSLCSGNVQLSGPPEHAQAAAIEAITGPGVEPDGGSGTSADDGSGDDEAESLQEAEPEATEDTPWLIVLPLAFGIPLAFLLIPSFLRKRSPGH